LRVFSIFHFLIDSTALANPFISGPSSYPIPSALTPMAIKFFSNYENLIITTALFIGVGLTGYFFYELFMNIFSDL
jgi:hypothetical protein